MVLRRGWIGVDRAESRWTDDSFVFVLERKVNYYKIDTYMLSELLKSSCYTKTDSKHLFFVREEHLGSGFKSNTTLKIVGPTRELECILNDDSDQGKAIRS